MGCMGGLMCQKKSGPGNELENGEEKRRFKNFGIVHRNNHLNVNNLCDDDSYLK